MDTRAVSAAAAAGGGATSYSDYMRCLAAKYNNNQPPTSTPVSSVPSAPSLAFKHDLLPLLAAHQNAFPAAFTLPLFNPFLTPARSKESPLLIPSEPSVTASLTKDENNELKRPKDDPLDLTEKKLKIDDTTVSEQPNKSTKAESPRPASDNLKDNVSLNDSSGDKKPDLTEWSVDQVTDFVKTVDDCEQYAKLFSDNLIDGTCLPKLTETHLTNVMGMKLGPAIKLITTIKSLLPQSRDSVCLQCHHCHNISQQ